MLKNLILFKIYLAFSLLNAQEIYKIEPPNWWIGMKKDSIQLMIYGKNLADIEIVSSNPGIEVLKVYHPENNNYAFADIKIDPNMVAGDYAFTAKNKSDQIRYSYPLLDRNPGKDRYRGFCNKDIIYLITPDRFVNGDTANDHIDGFRDGHRPEDILGRHGGDIQGIINKLDYLKNLGITAIWLNPLVENDMSISYHGYAVTDHYKIDPRFGSLYLYKELVSQAHKREIKVIMDHVSNHIGLYHSWMAALPDQNWINGTIDNHSISRHHKSVIFDPYTAETDKNNLTQAWFVREMPDLNQKNEQLAKYLIDNSIWWIETTGIDGIREDTYPYADQQFLAEWARVIREEYPDFNIMGEIWIQDPVFLAPFQEGSCLNPEGNTFLPAVLDFGLFEAFGRVFNRDQNVAEFYHMLEQDFLYKNTDQLVTFIDNHDVMRIWDLVRGNRQRYNMALKLLFTLRGIPQIYYGTEIGLPGGKDHGQIRRNFPGGFPGDERDAFTSKGRTTDENIIFETCKRLIRLRKNNPALSKGKMIHFRPENQFYVYFREYEQNRMLMIVNNHSSDRAIDLKKFRHSIPELNMLKHVETEEVFRIDSDKPVNIPAYEVAIYYVLRSI